MRIVYLLLPEEVEELCMNDTIYRNTLYFTSEGEKIENPDVFEEVPG